jgi:hypothetical protein
VISEKPLKNNAVVNRLRATYSEIPVSTAERR